MTSGLLMAKTTNQIAAFIVAFLSNPALMRAMSRPPRKPDAILAAQVAAHMGSEGLSARKLAKILNVNVTTLTRSLKLAEFSQDLREKLGKELDGNADDPINMLHKALHILREVDKIREEVEMAVRAAMKRLEAAR